MCGSTGRSACGLWNIDRPSAQSAAEYDDVTASAVLSVLLEIGQVLGAFRDRFVVIGGSVPWLLLPNAQPSHIGTLDIDLSLDAEALGDGDYKSLVDSLLAAGYTRNEAEMKWFQLRPCVARSHGTLSHSFCSEHRPPEIAGPEIRFMPVRNHLMVFPTR